MKKIDMNGVNSDAHSEVWIYSELKRFFGRINGSMNSKVFKYAEVPATFVFFTLRKEQCVTCEC